MEKKELDRIIANHQHWLKHDCEGWESMRADLSGADLTAFDLSGVNLSRANLSGTNLSGANMSNAILTEAKMSNAILTEAILTESILSRADLSGANMSNAILTEANLSRANLSGTNLSGANMRRAILHQANLSGADLYRTALEFADLSDAVFSPDDEIRKGIILKKAIKGYKKTAEGIILTAEIPAGAIVFSINGSKCRTNRAIIESTGNQQILHSMHDPAFTYRKGDTIVIDDFSLTYNVECAPGFHFFRTKKEAMEY